LRVGLFPGQGVPVRTVLQALPSGDPLAEQASEVLCYDLRKKVEQLARRERAVMPTSLAQPAILTASLIGWRDSGAEVDVLLGHSVGEYAALVAGGAMSFEHALCVVHVRGDAMHAASVGRGGGMVAVLGLGFDEVQLVATRTGVQIANDNAPGQVVVAGDEDLLVETAAQVRSLGGRAVRLDVSGPFHTPAVSDAVPALARALDHISIRVPQIPVVSNVTAEPYQAPGEIRKLLAEQVTSKVRFRAALEWTWRAGARTWIDFGPGSVVDGLARRTFRDLDASITVGA
jgi:[acyl-carrier-protein] S-malonyltransferase